MGLLSSVFKKNVSEEPPKTAAPMKAADAATKIGNNEKGG